MNRREERAEPKEKETGCAGCEHLFKDMEKKTENCSHPRAGLMKIADRRKRPSNCPKGKEDN